MTLDDGPVDPGSLRDEIYARIRAAILSGELEPGARIGERTVAQALGVSSSPAGAALHRLKEAGLVEARPGNPTTVIAVDMLQARQAGAVIGDAISGALRRNPTPPTAAVKRSTARGLARAVKARDIGGFLDAVTTIGRAAAARQPNPDLERIVDDIAARLQRDGQHLPEHVNWAAAETFTQTATHPSDDGSTLADAVSALFDDLLLVDVPGRA